MLLKFFLWAFNVARTELHPVYVGQSFFNTVAAGLKNIISCERFIIIIG